MKEIIQIAQSYIEKLNREEPFHADYMYGFNETPKEYFDSWYFDFKFLPIKPMKNVNIDIHVSASGFIILKENKTVQMIFRGFVNEMDEKEIRIKELDKILIQIKSKDWNLSKMRDLTGLEPIDILNLKEEFQYVDFSINSNRLIAIKEIENLIEKDDIF